MPWLRELDGFVEHTSAGILTRDEILQDGDYADDDDDDDNGLEPDLTCKEVIPYWLEEERYKHKLTQAYSIAVEVCETILHK